MRAKTGVYEPASLLADVVRLSGVEAGPALPASAYLKALVRAAIGRRAARLPRADRGTVYPELWQVVLSRSARSARLARHDDLDFPAEPAPGEYFCHKHRRVCRPVGEADKFLRRYVRDAVQRVQEFADVRSARASPSSTAMRACSIHRPVRPRLHLAALSGPHRLPRAARVRLRAARARAARRRRDRPRRQGLLRGRRRRPVAGARRTPARWEDRDRRERPPRALRRASWRPRASGSRTASSATSTGARDGAAASTTKRS